MQPSGTKKLAYGLNLTKPTKRGARLGKAPSAAFAVSAQEDEEDEEHNGHDKGAGLLPPTSALDRRAAVRSVNQELARGAVRVAGNFNKGAKHEELDPSVFDYDGVYEELKKAERKGIMEKKVETEDRKPRYIAGLLKTAEMRKRDLAMAEERKHQREREAEGNQYAGAESFTTASYKAHKEELERMREEEKLREAQEAANGEKDGLTGFYRRLLDQASSTRQAAVEASVAALGKSARVEKPPENSASDAGEGRPPDSAASRVVAAETLTDPTGKKVLVNADGEVVDKRQLLRAGLNVVRKSSAAAGTDPSFESARDGVALSREAVQRERERRAKLSERFRRTTRDLLSQKDESEKRKADEKEHRREVLVQKLAKKTTEEDAADARARYLARKKAREEDGV